MLLYSIISSLFNYYSTLSRHCLLSIYHLMNILYENILRALWSSTSRVSIHVKLFAWKKRLFISAALFCCSSCLNLIAMAIKSYSSSVPFTVIRQRHKSLLLQVLHCYILLQRLPQYPSTSNSDLIKCSFHQLTGRRTGSQPSTRRWD